jgi:hypothetical protein
LFFQLNLNFQWDDLYGDVDDIDEIDDEEEDYSEDYEDD